MSELSVTSAGAAGVRATCASNISTTVGWLGPAVAVSLKEASIRRACGGIASMSPTGLSSCSNSSSTAPRLVAKPSMSKGSMAPA
ncbi:hypothetical protein ABIC49_005375 [Burkholderia ambifaria]